MNAGVGLFQTETDSIPVVGDYKMSAGENRVFYPETQLRDSADNQPFLNSNINRQLTPDWILYILIALLLVLSWLRLTYNKYIGHLFEAAIQLSAVHSKYTTDPGIIQKTYFSPFQYPILSFPVVCIYICSSCFFGWYPAGLNWFYITPCSNRIFILAYVGHVSSCCTHSPYF